MCNLPNFTKEDLEKKAWKPIFIMGKKGHAMDNALFNSTKLKGEKE